MYRTSPGMGVKRNKCVTHTIVSTAGNKFATPQHIYNCAALGRRLLRRVRWRRCRHRDTTGTQERGGNNRAFLFSSPTSGFAGWKISPIPRCETAADGSLARAVKKPDAALPRIRLLGRRGVRRDAGTGSRKRNDATLNAAVDFPVSPHARPTCPHAFLPARRFANGGSRRRLCSRRRC